MSTDLGTRLEQLAADTAMTPGRPEELWQRGRTWQRRRNSGVALIAVVTVLVLAGLGGLAWQRGAPPPAPSSDSGQAVLPDRIFEPSPWLPGTADAGPPGQLVATIPADRGGWMGRTAGVVGISATTGEYHFLDLPDAAFHAARPTLSPDGTRVAYWLTGETSGIPNTEGGEPVVGVGVYDARTGAVSREVLPTEHGMWVEDLVWADNETLVFGHAQIRGDDDSDMDQSSAKVRPLRVWRPQGGASSRVLDLPHEVSGWHGYLVGTSMDGSVLISGESGKALWIVDVDRPETAVGVRLRTSTSEGLVLDPTGARLASVYYGDRNGSSPNRVVAGPLPPDAGRDRDVTLPFVPNSGRTFRVLAWTDATHVSVVRGTGDRFSEASAIFDVDVGTGSATQRVRLPDHSYGSGLHLATDLLSAPTVDTPEPQRPLDPRLVTGVGGGTLLLALFLALKWVRRVRP